MNKRRAVPALLLALLPTLTGCLIRTHSVRRSQTADVVMNASLGQLLTQVNQRFEAIQTISATIEIVATMGGAHTGEVKQYPSFSGYLFLRKPEDMRVVLLLPFIRTRAMDMVSDGKSFKLLIPPQSRAIVGTSDVTEPSKNGLENLRPSVFFDSLLVRGLETNQIVSMTQDVRLIEPENKKNALIEEPDYELAILGQPEGDTAKTYRVIHIGRTTLEPYQQDIYDATGHIATRAFYSNYQTYGEIRFPSKIVIDRPRDQYKLAMTITKLTFNEKLDNDSFDLPIPENVAVRVVK